MAVVRSSEIRAGFVILVGLVILAVGLFLVSGGREQLEEKKHYTVLFKNAGGITSGDTVLVAGQKAGQVTRVKTTGVTKEGVRRLYVAVTLEIDADLQIPADSEFWISKTITNIVTMHVDYGTAKKLATSDTELHGERLATFEEVVNKTFEMVDEAQEGVRTFNEIMDKVSTKVDQIDVAKLQGEAEATLASIRRAAAEAERVLVDNGPKVDGMVDDLAAASSQVRGLSEDLRRDWEEIGGKVDDVLTEARAAATEVKEILRENRPTVKSAVQALDDGLRRLAPVLERIEGVSREAEEAVIEVRPKLVRGVSAASAALENFKALTEDLKTAPWKLINKPSDEESRAVHLYNAARLYVDSAEKVADVIRELDTLRRLGALDDPQRTEVVNEALTVLQRALEDFQRNQDRLVALMEKTSAK